MTVSSVAGASAGKTQITVSPAKSVQANKYKYKIQSSDFTLPELDDDLTAWSDWDGTSEIDATNGYTIAVAETEPDYSCERVGKTIVVSPEPEPEPEGDTYTDGTTSLTISNGNFVLNQNGVETTGTANYSVPQTVGVVDAYFLEYEVDNAPKYALAEISGTEGDYTITITDNTGIFSCVTLSDNTDAYIPVTPTEHKGSYEAEIDAVTGATGYAILFDSTAQYLASLTIPVGVPVDIEMGDYGYVNAVIYTGGTKSQFESNVTITTNNTQITSVEYGSEDIFNLLFWETSVYDLELGSPDNTFTRTDSTISDVNKLSGTWTYVEDQQTGDSVWTLTYLDTTTEVFNVTYDEDDNQVVTHVEQGE